MASNEPISPALKEAPLKVSTKPTMDAAAYAADIRERRGDIIQMESRLGINATAPEGWEWHWFNDMDGRVERALSDGWRFVDRNAVGMSESVGRGNDAVGNRVSKTTTADGRVIEQVLMEIPEEIAMELRDARALAPVRKFEESINRGGAVGLNGGAHVYNPGDNPQSSFHGIHNHIGPQAA